MKTCKDHPMVGAQLVQRVGRKVVSWRGTKGQGSFDADRQPFGNQAQSEIMLTNSKNPREKDAHTKSKVTTGRIGR